MKIVSETQERISTLGKICRLFGVNFLYAFGSQAERVRDWLEGEIESLPKDMADVDIGAKGGKEKKWTVQEKVRLSNALEEFFRCSRVDLVFLDEADPFLAAEVIRGERIFAPDEHEADEYDLYILRRAGDLAPLERERMALILGESP